MHLFFTHKLIQSPLERAVCLLKAALPSTPHRSRILSLLSAVLFQPHTPSQASDATSPPQVMLPGDLIAIFQGLSTLLIVYKPGSSEASLAKDLFLQLLKDPKQPQVGNQNKLSFELNHSHMQSMYGIAWGANDDEKNIRAILCLEGIARSLENMTLDTNALAWGKLIEASAPE